MIDLLIVAGMAGAALIIVGAIVLFLRLRRRPRRLKTAHFQKRWQEIQQLCRSKDTWTQAVTDADKLLDEALKKKRFIGKTMGERLTHAQRLLSNNEDVWFGHKLRSKLDDKSRTKLREAEVKRALIGIRQALKDLGALPEAKPEPISEAPSAPTPTQTSKRVPKQIAKRAPAQSAPARAVAPAATVRQVHTSLVAKQVARPRSTRPRKVVNI